MKKALKFILIFTFVSIPLALCFTFTYFNLKKNNDDVLEKMSNISLIDDNIKNLLISYNKDKTISSIKIENVKLNNLFGIRYYLTFDVYEVTDYHIYYYLIQYEFYNVSLYKSYGNYERVIK